jgi:hypothetical protein
MRWEKLTDLEVIPFLPVERTVLRFDLFHEDVLNLDGGSVESTSSPCRSDAVPNAAKVSTK